MFNRGIKGLPRDGFYGDMTDQQNSIIALSFWFSSICNSSDLQQTADTRYEKPLPLYVSNRITVGSWEKKA